MLLASAFAIVACTWYQTKQDGGEGREGSVFSSTGNPDNGRRNSAVYIWFLRVFLFESVS